VQRIHFNLTNVLHRWLEPELFQPFVFGLFIALSMSEFVRGALTLSMLPTYGRTVLGFAVEYTALALSVNYLTDNLLRAPAGWLTDRIGQRTVLLIGFAIMIVAVVWMMHARTVAMFILSLALYGVGVTPVWPSAISGLGQATPDHKRGVFMSYLNIFWLVGAGLGPVVINFFIGRTYRSAFWLLIAMESAGFVMAFLLVHRPVKEYGIRKDARRTRMSEVEWRSLLRNIREVAFLFPGMFAQTFATSSLIPILSLYASVVLHISPSTYSTILIAGGGITVLLLIPTGKLVDKLGPRILLVSAFLVAGLGLGIYPFFPTLPMTYVMFCTFGLCYAFILPAWNAVLDRSIDKDKKGALWGVFMTVEGLGAAAGPYLGGLVWDRISPSAPFWVSASVIVVMGLLYTVLPIDQRHHRSSSGRTGTGGQASGGTVGRRGPQPGSGGRVMRPGTAGGWSRAGFRRRGRL